MRTRSLPAALAGPAGLAVGALAILGYHAAGRSFYRDFWVPQGYGMAHLLPEEFAHMSLFTVLGATAVAGLAFALSGSAIPGTLLGFGARIARRPGAAVVGLALGVLATVMLVSRFVLAGAAITDDEHVYRFIAQTMRTGSLTAPSPGGDLPFFAEQFVVLTDSVRYGKYPIGFPLLLAAGQAVGAEAWVVPLVTALLLPLLYGIGRALFDPGTALLATILFATSPQLVLTGATQLSQPASALFLLAGVAALLRAEAATGRRSDVWLAVAGGAAGYGVLVRPLPGILFVGAFAWYVMRRTSPWRGRRALAGLMVLLVPVVASLALILVCNHLQSGSALTSGYQAFHAPGAAGPTLTHVGGDLSGLTMSVVATLLRLNVWLLGWPLSLVLVAWAWGSGRGGLAWAVVAVACAYRLVSPKTGVGAVGPLYMFEVLPLLCLLVAHGVSRLAAREGPACWPGLSRIGIVSIVLAGALVNVAMLLPVKLENLRRMGASQLVLPQLMAERHQGRALVFHEGVAPPWTGLSWAYFPPCNSPGLDDDILFVRLQRDSSGLQRNVEFWRRRFPERSAWYFGYTPEGPRLLPLEQFVGEQTHPSGSP